MVALVNTTMRVDAQAIFLFMSRALIDSRAARRAGITAAVVVTRQVEQGANQERQANIDRLGQLICIAPSQRVKTRHGSIETIKQQTQNPPESPIRIPPQP